MSRIVLASAKAD